MKDSDEEYSSSLLSTTQSQPEIDSASPLKSLYESITAKLARVEEISKSVDTQRCKLITCPRQGSRVLRRR